MLACGRVGSGGSSLSSTGVLEWVCEVYWRAAAVGTPRTLDQAQLIDVVDAATARSYGSLRSAAG
jgi:L-fuculose-phosphate aldolase